MAPAAGGSFRTPEYYPSSLGQALFFRRSGHEVTGLVVGESDLSSAERMQVWKEENFAVIMLPPETEPFYPELLEKSWRTYHWLRRQDFDCIFFDDNSSVGLVSIQAKKLGESFAVTQLVYQLHGPAQWAAHLSDRRQLVKPDVVLPYSQQYAVENADWVVLPADYFRERIQAQGWRPGGSVATLPYLPQEAVLARKESQALGEDGRVIFPLHHSDHAGFLVFVQALASGPTDGSPWLLSVLCYGSAQAQHAQAKRVRLHLKVCNSKVDCEFFDGEKPLPCWDHALWVFSPFWFNLPALMLEAAIKGKRLLVADGAESRSIAALEDCRVSWTISGLSTRLAGFASGEWPRALPTTSDEAERAWGSQLMALCPDEPVRLPLTGDGRVTVCMAHFNKANYLAEALESLRAQTYENLEVIVVDDASTDPAARAAFVAAEGQFSSPDWKFIHGKENRGPGHARNVAAKVATGSYLLFFDADDVSFPDMVERLMRALCRPGVDCVAASSRRLLEVNGRSKLEGVSTYVGGSLENAFLHPPAGTVFVIARPLFEEVGGFKEDLARDCHEDWNFHIRLLAQEYRLHVLPDPVFAYRAAPQSRTLLVTRNMANNLEPFLEGTMATRRKLLFFALERAGALDSAVSVLAEYDGLAVGIQILRRIERWKSSIRRRLAWSWSRK